MKTFSKILDDLTSYIGVEIVVNHVPPDDMIKAVLFQAVAGCYTRGESKEQFLEHCATSWDHAVSLEERKKLS